MEKPQITPEIALAAADLFVEPESDLISTPALDNRPFPHSYSEYGLSSAAIEALLLAGVSSEAIYEHPGILDDVEEEIKFIVFDWKEILLQRSVKARILNSYSANDSFNPN